MPTGELGMMGAQATINTGSGFLGSVMGRIFGKRDRENQLKQQEALNEQALEMNKNMADYNIANQMKMWEATGYKGQVKQLQEAGLNPALLYGQGGGGGATTNAAQAQGVSAGQAATGRGGVPINPVSIMEVKQQQANIALTEAQTKKTLTEAQNIGEGGVNYQNTVAQTGNINADTKLKEAQQKIADLEATYQDKTLEQRISNLGQLATTMREQANQEIIKSNVARSTEEAQIQQVRANVFNTIWNTKTMQQAIKESKERVKLMDQQIQSEIQKRVLNMMQDADNLQNMHKQWSNEDLKRWAKQTAQEMNLSEDVVKMIGGAMIRAK